MHVYCLCCCRQDWDWTQPTAFVLGNEKSGVSQEAVQLADATMVVPMTGGLCMVGVPQHAAASFGGQGKAWDQANVWL